MNSDTSVDGLYQDTRGQSSGRTWPIALTIIVTAAVAWPAYTAYQHWGEPLYATKTVMRPQTVSYGLIPEVLGAMAPAILLLMVLVIGYGVSGGLPRRM